MVLSNQKGFENIGIKKTTTKVLSSFTYPHLYAFLFFWTQKQR